MTAAIIVFFCTYVLLASEKVDKTIATLLGAAVAIGAHLIPYEEALAKVDLNVIFLLIGMMVIVNILATTGVFEWIAMKVALAADGRGIVIMLSFMVLTAVLSAFLDNVTTVILLAPITILLTQILEVPTVPFLILEAIFSNIGGTATMIGDPPNILIGSQTSLSFNDFMLNLGPVIVVVILAALVATTIIFRKSTRTSENARRRIRKSRPELAIIEPARLRRSLVVFVLVLVGFFMGRALGIEPGIVALAGAMIMAWVSKLSVAEVLEKVEWNTILFFVGLFMLIGCLEANGVFELLGQRILSVTSGHLFLTAIVILWFSAILSAIVDNIPLVIAMIPLVKTIVPVFALQLGLQAPAQIQSQVAAPLFWALALGACLGGNGSLIGASANVVIAQVAKRNNYHLSFLGFTKYGASYMLGSLVISTAYIYLRYFV
jgi:Na+/H+ antiporter NhaD/arsenite permease-like protein